MLLNYSGLLGQSSFFSLSFTIHFQWLASENEGKRKGTLSHTVTALLRMLVTAVREKKEEKRMRATLLANSFLSSIYLVVIGQQVSALSALSHNV